MKAIIPLIFICAIGFLEIYIETPTDITPPSESDFSAVSAMEHIEKMGSEVHFMGTQKNREYRDYIRSYFKDLGVETELFSGYSQIDRGRYQRYAKTENIIARIKGTAPTKTLMLCAHYDSVLNGPGAADDVHAVACIMEVVKLLINQPRKNDILVLITDGEEMGLLGAQAYVENYDISELGLILNYEARGNSGPSISFEWSDGNKWLVEQLQLVGKKPMASSLSFEIYKMLPNDTDYSRFKEKGVPGINHAFIEGFSYYHNPDDHVDEINVASVQHTGDNMYRLAQHFVNQDLTDVRSDNASFFNFLGGLIVYPSNWDAHIIIFGILLFCFYVYKLFKAGKIQIKNYFLSFLLCLSALAISFLACYILTKGLYTIYPEYSVSVFYSGQHYNHMWYWGALTGLCLVIHWVIYSRGIYRYGESAMHLSAMEILMIVNVLSYFIISTASYVFTIPLILLLVLNIFHLNDNISTSRKTILKYVLMFAPVVILIPVYKSLYNAFSIDGIAISSIFFSTILLVLLASFTDIFKREAKLTPVLGLVTFLACMFIAHIKSNPTVEKPLPSSLLYVHNVDNQKSYWASYDEDINVGNSMYLKNAELGKLALHGSEELWQTETQTYQSIEVPSVEQDSSKILLRHNDEAYLTRVQVSDIKNIAVAKINGQVVLENQARASRPLFLDLFGMTQDSLLIEIEKNDPTIENRISVCTRYKKLPVVDEIPEVAVRAEGFSSVVQSFRY